MPVQSPYPRLQNVRAYVVDELTTRSGETLVSTGGVLDQLNVHSIRRLNDSVPGALFAYARIVGAGTKLYSGQNGFAVRATGMSGSPLSLVPYRPDQSPEPWMYVGDFNKMLKVKVDGTTFNMGVAPPLNPPTPNLAAPNFKIIESFDAIGTWSSAAPAGAITVPSRASTTITAILYDAGTTGWASIVPAAYPYTLQFHSLIIINRAGGTKETVQVEEVCPPTTSTTIAGIMYDSGITGPCSIVLTAPKTADLGLKRNAVILINSGGGTQEYIRVLAAIQGTGNQWSIRTSTFNNHAAGETATGVASFRAYCVNNHIAAETLDINCFQATMGVPTGPNFYPAVLGNLLGAQLDLSIIGTRPTQPDDELHISVAVDNPANVVDGRIFMDVDSTPANQDFNHNYYYWVFRGSDLASATTVTTPVTSLSSQQTGIQRGLIDVAAPTVGKQHVKVGDLSPYGFSPITQQPTLGSKQGQTGTGALQFSELVFKVSDLIRVGTDDSRTLANVINLRITLNVTASTVMQIGAWTLGGSYGPDVGDTGGPMFYRYRPRSSVTGAKGNPSPATRYGLMPHRAQITVPMTQHPDAQVDKLDIFRFGGDITSGWPYVGTVANSATPSFDDVYQDSDILATGQLLDSDNFQPFPTIDITRAGTCNVVGTSVQWVSGENFNTSWAEGSEIVINGIPYTLYRQPESTTFLEIVENAGNQAGVSFYLQEATILAQPEPAMWGPFLGEFFACGDPFQPGYIFRTKGNDPDSAPDTNQDEVTSPSDPMMNGCLYGSSASFCWSAEKQFQIQPIQDMNGNLAFQYVEVIGNGGLFARYAFSSGTVMAWLRKDGIMVSQGGSGQLITLDVALLFPHDGGPGVPVQLGSVTFQPPDMTQTNALRLSEEDGHIIFDYIDVNGSKQTMVYSLLLGVWSLDSYGIPAVIHYSEEGQGVHSVLIGGNDGSIYQLLGSTDAGVAVVGSARMPYIGDAFPSFSHVRDSYVGLVSSGSVSFVVNAEGVDSLVTLASTGGNYAKVYATLPALKAKAWEYGLQGNGPWTLYSKDTFVRQAAWGGDYQPLQPFMNMRRLVS